MFNHLFHREAELRVGAAISAGGVDPTASARQLFGG